MERRRHFLRRLSGTVGLFNQSTFPTFLRLAQLSNLICKKMETDTSATEVPYETKAARASIIAKPMASKKLAKKLFKLVKKSSKQKYHLRSGLKLVQTKIRKGETGIAIFAGSASPVDIICHLPAVCEDKNIPYVFVPTGRDIGSAMGVKRSTLVVLIQPHAEYQELYDECFQEVKTLPPPPPVEL